MILLRPRIPIVTSAKYLSGGQMQLPDQPKTKWKQRLLKKKKIFKKLEFYAKNMRYATDNPKENDNGKLLNDHKIMVILQVIE